MRRLPVFFVLDCSESMVGEKLRKMEDGLQAIVRALRSDPHALESVYISVIAFAGIARTIAPLLEVASFYPPKLPLGGGTSLGIALEVLMKEIDTSVVKTTAEVKGDWKPIVYLFTDGRPTDNPNLSIERWNDKYAQKATVIAVGLGKDVDFSILRRISKDAILFEDAVEGDFSKFVSWISASVVAHSKSVGESLDASVLPRFDENVMRVVKEPFEMVDEPSVTLVGRCQKSRKPYIIRYDREINAVATRDFKVDVASYILAGCYPLDEDYFVWSSSEPTHGTVDTSSLLGAPGCPHCGNLTAFAVCGCGKLLCVGGDGEVVCPWCDKHVRFAEDASGDRAGFDVIRGRG